jgi:hypothetical protein
VAVQTWDALALMTNQECRVQCFQEYRGEIEVFDVFQFFKVIGKVDY